MPHTSKHEPQAAATKASKRASCIHDKSESLSVLLDRFHHGIMQVLTA